MTMVKSAAPSALTSPVGLLRHTVELPGRAREGRAPEEGERLVAERRGVRIEPGQDQPVAAAFEGVNRVPSERLGEDEQIEAALADQVIAPGPLVMRSSPAPP